MALDVLAVQGVCAYAVVRRGVCSMPVVVYTHACATVNVGYYLAVVQLSCSTNTR
jgi:hypothetical protein